MSVALIRISSRSRPHVFAVRRRAIAPLDNARVNRADKLCELVKAESDTMGGTTIRRLANRIGWDASVQRFVIPAADVPRV